LAGESEIASAALLLSYTADPVVGSVVVRELPVLLDQETTFLEKGCLAISFCDPLVDG
jgi:hypothetical protein